MSEAEFDALEKRVCAARDCRYDIMLLERSITELDRPGIGLSFVGPGDKQIEFGYCRVRVPMDVLKPVIVDWIQAEIRNKRAALAEL